VSVGGGGEGAGISLETKKQTLASTLASTLSFGVFNLTDNTGLGPIITGRSVDINKKK
jgi:hypothetical protein